MPGKRFDSSTLRKQGYIVEDATSPLPVLVNNKHCRLGDPGSSDTCVLALAGKDGYELLHFWVVRTVAYGVFKNKPTHAYRWTNPPGTMEFLESFDIGKKASVPPGGREFLFIPPTYGRSLAYQDKRRQTPRKSSTQRGKKRRWRLPDPKSIAGVRSRFGLYEIL